MGELSETDVSHIILLCTLCTLTNKTINLSTNWSKSYVGYRQRLGFECKLNNYLLINQTKHSYPHLHSYMMKTKYSRV